MDYVFQEYPKWVYPNDEVDSVLGVLVTGEAEESAARKSFNKKPAPVPSAPLE